jgi:ABC-type amino acid transport/signal transduction systems, periplasmic component/domain
MKITTMLFALFILCQHSFAAEIVLVADKWCPYNCDAGAKQPGFMVEIAESAFRPHGHTIRYVNVAWSRAIHGTRDGQYDGIIGTGKEETPGFIFPDLALGLTNHTFYVNRASTWQYSGLDSLENVVLGVVQDYSYGSLYSDYIQPNELNAKRIQVIQQNGGLDLNIKKMLKSRIDVTIEDRAVFKYHWYINGIDNQFREAGIYAREPVYIAFSPKNNNAHQYAFILTEYMKKARLTGELENILAKYGLNDWVESAPSE